MRRIQLSFIISIFLSAAFSTEAQEAVDWAMKAVEYERTAFSSDDAFEANDALVEKAFCYKQCRRYKDALQTLGRVRMYMLSPERRQEVIYEKELCSYLAGEFEAAASFIGERSEEDLVSPEWLMLDALVLAECYRMEESLESAEAFINAVYTGEEAMYASAQFRDLYRTAPELKSEKSAMIRAFLPPLGHGYTGNWKEGVLSMGLNALAAAWTVWQCMSGDWISGLLGGGMALNYTVMGNQERCAYLVEKYNSDSMRSFNDGLRSLLLTHVGAE